MNSACNSIDNSTIKLNVNEVKEQYHELATIVKNSNDYKNIPAVQDCKFGSILYKLSFISISYQFLSKNSWAKASIEYVGQFEIKYKVQACLLQKSHPDREDTSTSTGVCNRYLAISANAILVANDHNFTKLSLILSVAIIATIPNDLIEHATKFYQILNNYYDQDLSEILALYTNSGPDHRYTYGSVQILLISKRIISILNLSLQNVSLQQDSMSSLSEKTFALLKTLEEIHNETENFPSLKNKLQNLISNI
ncbi:19730_t:CDS:2 [Racocetra persica]|uniref:19730_t:CDS:1 n=1 Tax=Racocetra persica TaxID=160502 RepID=A0ACA9KQE9_9GLOM|nr:19730_t:CDS:2 [Racocetra persica]